MAGGLVGAKTNATQEPQILGVQVTTSLYNQAIPLLIGKRRAAGHVIWYGDFGPSGGSGKKGKSASWQPDLYHHGCEHLQRHGQQSASRLQPRLHFSDQLHSEHTSFGNHR